jgi:MFS family permease
VGPGYLMPDREKSHKKETRSLRSLFQVTVVVGILCAFFGIFASSSREIYLPIFLTGRSYSASVIGIMMSVRGFSSMIARLLTGSVVRLVGNRIKTLGLSLAILALGTGLIPLCTNIPLLILSSIAVGIGFGIIIPISQAMVFENAPSSQKGIAMGLRMTSNRISQTSSPVLLGVVSQLFGVPMVFWVNGVILMTGTFVLFLWYRRKTP